jgi:hypothetical protein
MAVTQPKCCLRVPTIVGLHKARFQCFAKSVGSCKNPVFIGPDFQLKGDFWPVFRRFGGPLAVVFRVFTVFQFLSEGPA